MNLLSVNMSSITILDREVVWTLQRFATFLSAGLIDSAWKWDIWIMQCYKEKFALRSS